MGFGEFSDQIKENKNDAKYVYVSFLFATLLLFMVSSHAGNAPMSSSVYFVFFLHFKLITKVIIVFFLPAGSIKRHLIHWIHLAT